jgi:hypothetical protein
VRLVEHPDFEQAILLAAAHFADKGLRPAIIEKDYFVTEALRAIADASGDKVLFKGGTSLSKGWDLIRIAVLSQARCPIPSLSLTSLRELGDRHSAGSPYPPCESFRISSATAGPGRTESASIVLPVFLSQRHGGTEAAS